jgi:hypothetical protein
VKTCWSSYLYVIYIIIGLPSNVMCMYNLICTVACLEIQIHFESSSKSFDVLLSVVLFLKAYKLLDIDIIHDKCHFNYLFDSLRIN